MTRDRDRRAALLAAAAQEFAIKGFAGGRVARIAAGAGVNKQLVFYYFGSKRGLYDAVVHESPAPAPAPGIDREATGTATPPPATEDLRVAVRSLFEWLREHPQTTRAFYDPQTPSSTTRELLERAERRIRTVISSGQGLGYFRDAADPALVARQAAILCAGYLALATEHNDQKGWVIATEDLILSRLAW